MMEETIHGELVAKKSGIYTVYVFQTDTGQYIMCTKLPKWGEYNIQKGDKGFLTFDKVLAGEKYYDRDGNVEKTYQYSNIYFKDFIKDKDVSNEIIL